MAIDVTEHRAEEAQAFLAAIVESSNDAIVSITLDGKITSWNAAAERLFGYRADEVIGRSIMTFIPPERQAEEEEILSRLRRDEQVEHYDAVRLTKTGRPIDVSLTLSPIRDKSQRIVGASKVVRDVSSRKRAEQLLGDSEGRLSHFGESRSSRHLPVGRQRRQCVGQRDLVCTGGHGGQSRHWAQAGRRRCTPTTGRE